MTSRQAKKLSPETPVTVTFYRVRAGSYGYYRTKDEKAVDWVSCKVSELNGAIKAAKELHGPVRVAVSLRDAGDQ